MLVDTSIRCVPKKNQFKTPQRSNNTNQPKSSLRDSKESNNKDENHSSYQSSKNRNSNDNQVIQWSWAEDDGTWVDYPELVNLRIESAYQNQEPSVSVDRLRYASSDLLFVFETDRYQECRVLRYDSKKK